MVHEPRTDVQIDDPFAGAVSEDLIRRVAAIALGRGSLAEPGRVAVLITDDDTVRRLNRDFRCVDEVTDVLAFSAREGWHDGRPPAPVPAGGPFPVLHDERDHLGDIAISCPQAARQAEEAGTSLDRELALLVAHGVLHLLGFDHSDPDREAAMYERTRSILAEAFGQWPEEGAAPASVSGDF